MTVPEPPIDPPLFAIRPLPGKAAVLLLICGGVITAFCLWCLHRQPFLIHSLDLKVYDAFLRAAPSAMETESRVVIVGLDDASLRQYGQWPWPRYRLAAMVRALQESGARVIGLDILLAGQDRTSLAAIRDAMQRDLHLTTPFTVSDAAIIDNDACLAAALEAGSTILGFKCHFSSAAGSDAAPDLRPLQGIILDAGRMDQLYTAEGVTTSYPPLAEAAAGFGFINSRPDGDGVLRRVPLIIRYRNQLYPSLSLALLQSWMESAPLTVSPTADGIQLSWRGKTIPLDGAGNLMVRFRGTGRGFPTLSAADILNGTFDPGAVRGRMVLIGALAPELGDRHVTPVESVMPGVAVQATAIENMRTGAWVSRPAWSRFLELLLVGGGGAAATVALVFGNVLWCIGVPVLASAGVLGATGYLLSSRWMVYLSPTLPLLNVWLIFTLFSALRYGIEAARYLRSNRALIRAQGATIVSLTTLSETRDPNTGGHVLRTQCYVRLLVEALSKKKPYRRRLDPTTRHLLCQSAPLHDIGKVGIPDQILRKSGRYTTEEYAVMQAHPRIGYEALKKTEQVLGERLPYLATAKEMVLTHHERWDGTGYPAGLKAQQIPLAGRLMALADLYDAVTTRRPYKPALPHEKAKEIIISERGRQFDPELVDLFLEIETDFRQISRRFGKEAASADP